MSVDWLTIKSCLDGFNVSVTYIDDEGNEIPIESECEFKEAIKLSVLTKQRLKLILYLKYFKWDYKNQRDPPKLFFDLLQTIVNIVSTISFPVEQKCHCKGDAPPEWFNIYMRKLKREITYEIKSTLSDIFLGEVEQDKKLRLKDDLESPCDKAEGITTSVTAHGKKKKKGWEKDFDLMNQREVKLVRRIEKLHPLKFERLDKLDSRTKMMLEDRRRIMERKRHLKPAKIIANQETGRKAAARKSASFGKNEMCAFLAPNAKFAVNLNFTNNGLLRWEAPWLECFDFNGLYPEEKKICLRRLLPMENGCTTLRGRVSGSPGLHHFKCRLFDGLENIGPEFTCWARVEEPSKTLPDDGAAESKDCDQTPNENVLDFENYKFSATRKKIKENITEIERRLQDIDLLRPKVLDLSHIRKHIPMFQTEMGATLLQNLEKAKEKLEEEDLNSKLERLHVSDSSQVKKHKKGEKTKTKKRDDCDNSSDSELSVIYMSEEDENFIVVPFPSKSPSLAESADEDKKFSRTGSEDSNEVFGEAAEPTAQDALDALAEEKVSRKVDEAASVSENSHRQLGSVKNRCPPVGEEALKLKSKKIKPSSTKYHFTTANLTQPIFTQTSERFDDLSSKCTFTFSGESDGKTGFAGGCSKPTSGDAKKENSPEKEDFKRRKIDTTDASGKIIYAIHNSGRCFPVEDLLKFEDRLKASAVTSDHLRKKNRKKHLRRSSQFGQLGEVPTVDVLPSVLMNTASNVASIALNTAKSVIINWQSALGMEGKPELGELD